MSSIVPTELRCIIIDDDRVTVFMSNKIIHTCDENIVVDTFQSGLEALAYFKENPISPETVILLDINMPNYSGWDFLKDFEELRMDCKVFMFSASIDSQDMEKSNSHAIVKGFISKPLTTEKVAQLFPSTSN